MANMSRYDETVAAWLHDREAFWAKAAEGIDWDRKWDRVFDPALGAFGQWFAGGMLNTCFNALDRHVRDGHRDPTGL